MSLYYPIPQPTIAANILVRRERRLPVPGEVLVRAGQRIEPSDIVAQSALSAEPVPVDIAADLDLSPGAATKRLTVSLGSYVEQGTVLAQRGGFGSRVSRAPISGTFTAYDPATGLALITTHAEPLSVQAHIKGIVTDLIPYHGAIIETPATVVRGIFGVGGEAHGVLKAAVGSHADPLTHDAVDARVAYAVVLGGGEVTAEGLRRAIELGARGVIGGSIRASELADFLGYPENASWALGAASGSGTGWEFPPPNPHLLSPVPPDFVLIITEGFGALPMTARLFELLASYDGQEVAVDGTTRLRGGLARPEIVVPLARTTPVRWLDEGGPRLEVGTRVRLLSHSYLGQQATVTGLPAGPRTAQSGIVCPVADVQLPGGMRLRVPVVDLEVLE